MILLLFVVEEVAAALSSSSVTEAQLIPRAISCSALRHLSARANSGDASLV